MIFPKPSGASETIETSENSKLGCSLAFDFKTKSFRIIDGSPAKVTGVDAVAQWLELFVKTVPERYGVYEGEDFGVDSTKLIGKKVVPNGAVLSEIKREIEEGVPLCPAIQSVYGFNMLGDTITFMVVLKNGEESGITIEL